MEVTKLLLDLSDDVFARTKVRLDGLTDEEMRWEPAPYCWTVRRRGDGTPRADWAPYIGGAEVTDDAGTVRTTSLGGEPRRPPPFTGLAWRLWHLTGGYGSPGHQAALQRPALADSWPYEPIDSADAAVAALSAAHQSWRNVLASLTDAELDDTVDSQRGSAPTKAGYVTWWINEFIHHGAEVGVLRDLYAHTHQPEPRFGEPVNLARVAWAGMWHLVPQLAEDGADVNAESGGASVLHLACAAGERDIVELLLDRGADLHVRHRVAVVWGGPGRPGDRELPIDWAEHFARSEVVDLLRGRAGA